MNSGSEDILGQLSPVLFWDVDKAQTDIDRHARFLIQRVLEYGEMRDWQIIRNYYGLDKIVECCKQMRTLDPVCLAFICGISHTDKEDYRCYQFRQSTPTLWNS